MVQDSDERQDLSPQIVNSDKEIGDLQATAINNLAYENFDYQWIVTKDNSLTLKSTSLQDSEWMHSLHGAYSESQYIYGDALRMALKNYDRSKTLNVFSMGLGLGYLEFIALFECAKVHQKVAIYSYEYDPKLQRLFKVHCQLAKEVLKNESSEMTDYYQKTFKQTAEKFDQGFLSFFKKDYEFDVLLQGLALSESVIHHGPFKDTSLKDLDTKFQIIFYDAFSSSTQSELWSESFLTQMLTQISDPALCIFTTYAKVGALNRALKAANFEPQFKKGFAFKRESTLAKRCQVPFGP